MRSSLESLQPYFAATVFFSISASRIKRFIKNECSSIVVLYEILSLLTRQPDTCESAFTSGVDQSCSRTKRDDCSKGSLTQIWEFFTVIFSHLKISNFNNIRSQTLLHLVLGMRSFSRWRETSFNFGQGGKFYL